MTTSAPSPSEKPPAAPASWRRRLALKITCGAAGVLALGGIVAYAAPASAFGRGFARVLPYPAAIAGGRLVTLAEYEDAQDARAAYARAVPAAGKSAGILDALIDRRLTERIGARLGVKRDDAAVDAMMRSVTEGAGGDKAFADAIKRTFGWNAAAYRARIAAPVAYAAQVNKRVLADADVQAPVREAARKAFLRLGAGEDFAAVADTTNVPGGILGQGGDLGYRNWSELSPAWQSAIAGLRKGDHTPVIEEADRYALLAILDRIRTGEDEQIHLAAIIVPKRTLSDVLADERVHSFVWHIPNPE